jgi:hypothetical protein
MNKKKRGELYITQEERGLRLKNNGVETNGRKSYARWMNIGVHMYRLDEQGCTGWMNRGVESPRWMNRGVYF